MVYIGATKRTLHDRWNDHVKYSKKYPDRKLYSAINEFGIDKFSIECLYETDSFEDLYLKEAEYISMYDSVNNGYNTLSSAPQREDWEEYYDSFKRIMHSDEVRSKISNSLKTYRKNHGFSKEHLQKISLANKGRKLTESRRLLCATRSISCYCIKSGIRYDFSSYKDAGLWWYRNYKPFGESYSQATYQRKIISCIETGYCTYRNPDSYEFITITKDNIEWYRV